MTKEKILEEFNKKLLKVCDVYEKAADNTSEKLENWEKEREEIKQFISDLIDKTKKETREETIKEIEESLPEQAPPIIDILGTEEEHNHNERIRARISGFNSCLGVIKEELNKLKN